MVKNFSKSYFRVVNRAFLKSSTPKTEILLKDDESCSLNVVVIYPRG